MNLEVNALRDIKITEQTIQELKNRAEKAKETTDKMMQRILREGDVFERNNRRIMEIVYKSPKLQQALKAEHEALEGLKNALEIMSGETGIIQMSGGTRWEEYNKYLKKRRFLQPAGFVEFDVKKMEGRITSTTRPQGRDDRE